MGKGQGQGPLSNATLILLRNLRSEDAATRQSAAMALGRLGNPDAIPGLLEALRDESDVVRQAAAWALGQVGDSRATSGLTEALADPAPHVHRAAATALGWMTGDAQNAPTSPMTQRNADESHLGRKRRRRRPHHHSQLTRTGITIGSLMVILLGILALLAIQMWNTPLGPELVGENPIGNTPSAPEPITVSEPANPPLCGGPPIVYLLVVGSDSRENDYEGGFADVIRVIRVDFVTPSAMLLSIPRDLWVPIPGLERYSITENRIKTAYAYGNHYDVPGGGSSLLAQTLAQNFEIHLDHYVIINFGAFEEGIDAIGGIDINVPESLDDPLSTTGYFPVGWQHMDGATALRYARVREDITDLRRIERQSQVIMAIRERVLSPQIWPSLPGLIQSMRPSILTDLSPSEIAMLQCIGEQMEPDAIQTVSVDTTMTTPIVDTWGHEILLPDYDAIAELIQAFSAGNPP